MEPFNGTGHFDHVSVKASIVQFRVDRSPENMRGYFIFAIAHTTRSRVKRILREPFSVRDYSGEDQFCDFDIRPVVLDHLQRLIRQRHHMLPSHLHAFGRNAPTSLIKIELLLPCAPNFTGPRHRQNLELHRVHNDLPTGEGAYFTQQRAEGCFIDDRCPADMFRWL
ncbi:MAG: hypothetical protein AAF583_15740 [Pseudomonadota bacterium]